MLQTSVPTSPAIHAILSRAEPDPCFRPYFPEHPDAASQDSGRIAGLYSCCGCWCCWF
jgi:hypothetical protein